MSDAPAPARPDAKPLSAPQKALRKLGLERPIDLALHLPLRYEDETRLTRLADAPDGGVAQIEGVVTHQEIALRGRRQLLVTVDDGSAVCVLRFFNFYPSQQKQMAAGARIRARGELRGGFGGLTMMHPVVRAAGGELPSALTPVYSTVAQLPQPYLRKAVLNGLALADLSETVPAEILGLMPNGAPSPGAAGHPLPQGGGQGSALSVERSASNPQRPAFSTQPPQLQAGEGRGEGARPPMHQGSASSVERSASNAQRSTLNAQRQAGEGAAPPMRLWSLRDALSFLHQPAPDVALAQLEDHTHPAWQRLKAEELLAQQLSQLQARRARDRLRAPALRAAPDGVGAQLLAALPFQLTAAQGRVVGEIARDLARAQPMHRLLQGDVGSGKTVVAALAAAAAIDAGWQCALMAPTEILAGQHFARLADWLAPLLAPRGQRVAWLTGSQKKKARAEMLALIESGQAPLVIGTHAVIQEQVRFQRLGLAVIDEQHRFGVRQRLDLLGKLSQARQEPHLLMMSATPIPRTLAMSYYADLDVSTIDELPPGRTPVVTKLVAERRRGEVIERIRAQLAQGRQVYWVCPLIEESEALDLRNATQTHAELTAALPGHAIGLLHSRMPAAEKKATMQRFTSGELPALVSTTVIEVGVDVPNASLMVIEHAERFGLSQLHQLRGRVGRGAAASACVLLYSVPEGGRLGETARARLKAMQETGDGFEIARRDLDIRGPGEFLGARQSGAALLRFADLANDAPLLQWARRAAPRMLDAHPDLAARHMDRWLGNRFEYLKA
jgi:ATP-dependent DNA helicase RecG